MIIATHDGVFHADEVFASAILKRAFYPSNIVFIRSRDPEVLAKADFRVDVGGKHNPKTRDYDHHHDAELPASCNLVWETHMNLLCDTGAEQAYVRRTLLDPISGLDCNFTEYSAANPIGPYKTVGQAVMDFNRDPSDPNAQMIAFEKAVDFAVVVLTNTLYAAKQYAKHIQIIESGIPFAEFGLELMTAIPYNEFREQLGSKLLVYPDPVSGWCIVSLDVKQFNLSNAEGAIFAHKAGFFAKYATREGALKWATLCSDPRSEEIDQWAVCHNDGNGARTK